MSTILGIGIAAVDIINETRGYPDEDSEVRAVAHETRRGGNATNTLVVLSQLGHQCHWVGSIADDPNSDVIREDLKRHGVSYSLCELHRGHKSPVSYIVLNQVNGSRTIVHYRDLPELSAEHFRQLKFQPPDWIHLEGRNTEQTVNILEHIHQQHPGVPVSIEIEKPRDNLELLFGHATIYFFSRHFATLNDYDSAEQLLVDYRSKIPSALLVCTWGAAGAYAMDNDQLVFSDAPKIGNVVDSIGAGDAFNAAFIDGSLKGLDTTSCLKHACKIAASKCMMRGLDGIKID